MRLLCALLTLSTACRIERVAPEHGPAQSDCDGTPRGDLWVYTSMYRQVLDTFDPLLHTALPAVTVHWFQSGSEKVASRLEAELAAGGTQADVLLTSDPFYYERLKRQGLLQPYASASANRVPRTLVDADADYAAARLSTMVLVHRQDLHDPPASFRALTDSRWRGRVAVGDPLASGTAATWAIFLEARYGADYFTGLRQNGALVAGGNAAVLQKVEGKEADVGVLLLENALGAIARGSPLAVRYPDDGAVVIPGHVAILKSSRNPLAARAFYDLLMSPQGQALIVAGDMHSVDPRQPGPRQEPALAALLEKAQPWSEALIDSGVARGAEIKAHFSEAFAR